MPIVFSQALLSTSQYGGRKGHIGYGTENGVGGVAYKRLKFYNSFQQYNRRFGSYFSFVDML